MAATLVINNRDRGTHTFTVETRGSNVAVNRGSETVVELRDLPTDTYTFICRVFESRSS